MNRTRTSVIAALAMLAIATTAPAIAAESRATVKVALTDMSASMGMCPLCQSMMGQGMMSPGMIGFNMMSPGGMGQGMMMGMMAVRIDRDTVKAGSVSFDVTNWSRGMKHEMLIIAVDAAGSQLPYDYTSAKVAEGQVKLLADTSELAPNTSHTLDVTLAAGTYLLICNVPGHYAAGMAVPLVVTQ